MSDSNMLANACQQRAVSLSVVNHEVSQPQINNNEHLFQLFRQSLRYKFLLLAITPSIHKRSLLSVHTSDSHTYTIKFSSDSHSYTSGHSYKLHSRSKPEAALLLSCRNHEGANKKTRRSLALESHLHSFLDLSSSDL